MVLRVGTRASLVDEALKSAPGLSGSMYRNVTRIFRRTKHSEVQYLTEYLYTLFEEKQRTEWDYRPAIGAQTVRRFSTSAPRHLQAETSAMSDDRLQMQNENRRRRVDMLLYLQAG